MTRVTLVLSLRGPGLDFLSISKGGKFEDAQQPKVGQAVYPYTGKSGYECMPTTLSDATGPFGRTVPLVAEINALLTRRVSRRLSSRPAVSALSRKLKKSCRAAHADIVGFARQALADPDWF